MRASIIQLKELLFQRISVEAAKPLHEIAPGEATGFDFNNVRFHVGLETGAIGAEGETEPRLYGITLRIAIDNSEGKPAPYKMDIVALGVIEVSDKVEKEKRADLAAVNGASLVYGAIREVVLTLTSRSVPGHLILPTMDFRDHSEKRTAGNQDKVPAKATK